MSRPSPYRRLHAVVIWPWIAISFLAGAATADSSPVPIKNGVTYTAREASPIGDSRTIPIENASSPDEKTVPAPVIIFDAQPASSPGGLSAAGFITPIPSLRDGSPAELRIYNPNSYLNSYELSCAGIDYHTSPPPSGLSSLLLTTRGSRGVNTGPAPTANDMLTTDYNNFTKADAQEINDSAGLKTCLNTIAQAIMGPEATNASVRVAAIPAIASLLGILSPPTPTNNATLFQNGRPALMVTDFTPDQEADLQKLLMGIKHYDISTLNADNATLSLWYKAWTTDYPKFANDPGAAAENDEVQLDEANAASFGDGSATLDNIIAIYTAASDFEATPTYYVERVNQVTGVDEEKFTVSVGAKPPTSKFAQVDVDNTSIGLSGATSQTYVAQANVYGRVVLDFSAGVATSTLRGHNYYSSGTTHIVHQGNSDSAEFAVGALSTLYRTQESGLAIGPSLGAASGNGPQYLLGISFIGTIHHSRLILTIGGESGNVTELNGDHVGQPTNGGNSSVATTSVQRFGGFAMLSWSVFTF
jgi:hypothetical protein